jgi:hypothetical protein
MLLVSKILPPTSLVLPLIAKYLLFTFIMNCISILCTVVIINWNFRGPRTHRMPTWIRRLFLHYLPVLLFIRRPTRTRLARMLHMPALTSESELRSSSAANHVAEHASHPASTATSTAHPKSTPANGESVNGGHVEPTSNSSAPNNDFSPPTVPIGSVANNNALPRSMSNSACIASMSAYGAPAHPAEHTLSKLEYLELSDLQSLPDQMLQHGYSVQPTPARPSSQLQYGSTRPAANNVGQITSISHALVDPTLPVSGNGQMDALHMTSSGGQFLPSPLLLNPQTLHTSSVFSSTTLPSVHHLQRSATLHYPHQRHPHAIHSHALHHHLQHNATNHLHPHHHHHHLQHPHAAHLHSTLQHQHSLPVSGSISHLPIPPPPPSTSAAQLLTKNEAAKSGTAFYLSAAAYRATEAIEFIAEHLRSEDEYIQVRFWDSELIKGALTLLIPFQLIVLLHQIREDWKYVAMVIDRLQLYIFFFVTVFGTMSILLDAPHIFEVINQDEVIALHSGKCLDSSCHLLISIRSN